MFQSLDNMVYLDISTFKVKSGATINYMFGKCPKLQRIYVSEDSGFENAAAGILVFQNDGFLVGGYGENETKFSYAQMGSSYARISTADNPGYFTNIEEKEED